MSELQVSSDDPFVSFDHVHMRKLGYHPKVYILHLSCENWSGKRVFGEYILLLHLCYRMRVECRYLAITVEGRC